MSAWSGEEVPGTPYSYSGAVLEAACRGLPAPDVEVSVAKERALTGDDEASVQLTVLDQMSLYSRPLVDEDLQSVVPRWYDKKMLTVEEVMTMVVGGVLDYKRVFKDLWVVYARAQHNAGVEAYESVDMMWAYEVTDAMSEVTAQPVSVITASTGELVARIKTFYEEWGDLKSLRKRPPKIPIDHFPRDIRVFIEEYTKYAEIGQDMVTGLCLGALGAAVSHTVRYDQSGHEEPLTLAMLMLSSSGERKSGTYRSVMKPLKNIERELIKRDEHARRSREIEISNIQAEIALRERGGGKRAPGEPGGIPGGYAAAAGVGAGSHDRSGVTGMGASSGSHSAEATATADAVELNVMKMKLKTLESQQFSYASIFEDITPEALAHKIAQSWTGSAAIMSDDSNLFEQASGMYGAGQSKFQIYLKASSGEDNLVTRRGDTGSRYVPAMSLSMSVMLQPEIYEGFIARNPAAVSSGLVPRMCVLFPEQMIGYRTYGDYKLASDVEAGWALMLERMKHAAIKHIEEGVKAQEIARFEADIPEDDDYVPYRLITLDDIGKTLHRDWLKEREQHMRPGERFDTIKAWVSKSGARVPVIAALFTLSENPDATVINSGYIPVAIDVVNAMTEHSLYAAESRGESRAQAVLNWLQINGEKYSDDHGRISVRDLKKGVHGQAWTRSPVGGMGSRGFKSAVDEVLEMLEGLGYLKLVEVKGKGRPSVVIVMRPIDL